MQSRHGLTLLVASLLEGFGRERFAVDRSRERPHRDDRDGGGRLLSYYIWLACGTFDRPVGLGGLLVQNWGFGSRYHGFPLSWIRVTFLFCAVWKITALVMRQTECLTWVPKQWHLQWRDRFNLSREMMACHFGELACARGPHIWFTMHPGTRRPERMPWMQLGKNVAKDDALAWPNTARRRSPKAVNDRMEYLPCCPANHFKGTNLTNSVAVKPEL